MRGTRELCLIAELCQGECAAGGVMPLSQPREAARRQLRVRQGEAAALDEHAPEEANRRGLVALGLRIEQDDADREGVVQLDMPELGGGGAHEKRVPGGERPP